MVAPPDTVKIKNRLKAYFPSILCGLTGSLASLLAKVGFQQTNSMYQTMMSNSYTYGI